RRPRMHLERSVLSGKSVMSPFTRGTHVYVMSPFTRGAHVYMYAPRRPDPRHALATSRRMLRQVGPPSALRSSERSISMCDRPRARSAAAVPGNPVGITKPASVYSRLAPHGSAGSLARMSRPANGATSTQSGLARMVLAPTNAHADLRCNAPRTGTP